MGNIYVYGALPALYAFEFANRFPYFYWDVCVCVLETHVNRCAYVCICCVYMLAYKCISENGPNCANKLMQIYCLKSWPPYEKWHKAYKQHQTNDHNSVDHKCFVYRVFNVFVFSMHPMRRRWAVVCARREIYFISRIESSTF